MFLEGKDSTKNVDLPRPSSEEKANLLSNVLKWLQEVDSQKFDYVTCMSRRGFNLVEIVLKKNKGNIQISELLTENALLMKAEEISRIYMKSGTFPSMVILDDILVHGRNMNRILVQFWRIVEHSLKEDLSAEALEKAESDFNKAVVLWVFAVNKSSILLRHAFRDRLRYQQILPTSEWRSLSNTIAVCLWENEIANTSYVISADILEAKISGEWEEILQRLFQGGWFYENSTCYRQSGQDFFIFRGSVSSDIYPSVRCYVKEGRLYFTPYFFIFALNSDETLWTLQEIFCYAFQQNPQMSNCFIELLNSVSKCARQLTLYSQLLYLLLSQITLDVFLQTGYVKWQGQFHDDTEKIARNFGGGTEMTALLKEFCHIRWTREFLETLMTHLDKSVYCDADNGDALCQGKTAAPAIVSAMEQLTYRQAVRHERNAKEEWWNRSANTEEERAFYRSGEEDLTNFLRQVWRGTKEESYAIMPSVLSCLTQMMDRGDLSLKARIRPLPTGKVEFYSAVRTTELSMAIMPRKITSAYYARYVEFAQFYWRDPDFPDRAREYFTDVVFGGDPDRGAEVIDAVVELSEMIRDNQLIADSILDWSSVVRTVPDEQHDL